MILLIDQGNSRLKWALTSAGHWQSGIADDLHALEPEQVPEAVLLSSVAGQARTDSLCRQVEQIWSLAPQLVSVQPRAYGVTNCYRDCSQMGTDRWLATIAAHHYYPKGALVIDAGTALTLDTVDAGGNMLGGAIFPGPGLMLSALGDGTADIGLNRSKPFARDVGLEDATGKALMAGVEHGYVGAADHLVSIYCQRLPDDAAIVITGGWAKVLLNALNHAMIHKPDLVLEGLAVVAGVEQ